MTGAGLSASEVLLPVTIKWSRLRPLPELPGDAGTTADIDAWPGVDAEKLVEEFWFHVVPHLNAYPLPRSVVV